MRDRLNLPIEFNPARNGYFYTGEVSAFPTMQITEGELFALVVAEKALQQYRGTSFEKPLLSAIRKMEQALPDTISLNLADIEQTISFRTRAEPILDLKIFDALARAVAQRQQLELHYRKPGQAKAEARLVDPYHLANINGEWFLFAHDHARKDIRTFVPARIQSVKPTGKTFERSQKFSLEKRLRDSFGVHSGEGEFEVVIRFNAARRRLCPRKEMAPVAAIARIEGRGSGIETEAVEPRRNRALGLELGRRRESLEAARIGRSGQEIGAGDIEATADVNPFIIPAGRNWSRIAPAATAFRMPQGRRFVISDTASGTVPPPANPS